MQAALQPIQAASNCTVLSAMGRQLGRRACHGRNSEAMAHPKARILDNLLTTIRQLSFLKPMLGSVFNYEADLSQLLLSDIGASKSKN